MICGLLEGRDLPDAPAAPRRVRARGGLRDPAQHAERRRLIREGKTFQIPTAIQTGAASGMVLMDGALRSSCRRASSTPTRRVRPCAPQGGLRADARGRRRDGRLSYDPRPTPARRAASRVEQPHRPLPRDPADAQRLGPASGRRVAADPALDGELERSRYRDLTEADYENLVAPDHAARDVAALPGDGRRGFRLPDGTGRALPREPLPPGARVGGRVPADPVARPDHRGAGPAGLGRRLFAAERGLVLVTGPTGSGKSTTLAAILDRVNKRLRVPRRHDRGPDRVRAHERPVRLHAARARRTTCRRSPRA